METSINLDYESPEGREAWNDALGLVAAWRGGVSVYQEELARQVQKVLTGGAKAQALRVAYLIDAVAALGGAAIITLAQEMGISAQDAMLVLDRTLQSNRHIADWRIDSE